MRDDANVDFDPATGVVGTTPRQIFLETSSRCNLACVHCSKDFGKDEGHPKLDFPIETVRRLRPWLEQADEVNLNIVGEPLLHPQFEEIVELSCGGRAEVGFNTNGLLLTERLCEHMVRAGVGSVIVSIDGMESNEPIRGVPYAALREKLILLDRVRRRMGASLPKIGVAFTLMRRTLGELPRVLADLLPRVRLDAFHVQPLLVFYETVRHENVYEATGIDEVLSGCATFARSFGTRFTTFRSSLSSDERHEAGALEDKLGQASRRFGCIDPFFEIKIRSDGSIMSCSYGLTPGLDVHSMALDDIWNHDWYRALRMRLFARRFTGDCERCPYVFGSSANQMGHLRPGVEHSAAARFHAQRAGGPLAAGNSSG